jgi:hypothetical protein
MKKTIRLTERDLTRLVKKILSEQPELYDMELDAMKEIKHEIEKLIDFAEGKCMEVYSDETRCENFLKVMSETPLKDIVIDYKNIFNNLRPDKVKY